MKIKKIFLFLILYSSIFSANTAEVNKILVKIDNELITSYDVKNKIITALLLAKKEINQKNINDLKRKSLEDLIQNRLKKIELKKYNLAKDSARINSYLNSISSNNITDLESLFKKNNADFKIFVEDIDLEFKWRLLIYNMYSKKIEIDQDNLNKQVSRIMQNQNSSVKYNLSEIEILSNNDDLDSEKIFLVKNEIKNSSFEDAVVKFSISPSANNMGLLGWVNSESMSNEILRALNKLKIGQISNPIKKQNKIVFLKLNDKKMSNYDNTNVDELKAELIEQKKNELFILYSSSLLSKLRNTKFIEYYK
tara:strand:- start:6256 stop:7182 length:927 start_codon:yes stop_codon:yes gene_type:complete